LMSPFSWSNEIYMEYTSLTLSCGAATSWAVASPTSQYALRYVTSTPVAPIMTLMVPILIANYTIQASDSCQSISRSKQVLTFYLMFVNKLPAYCASFPAAGTSICIPQSCPVYTVSPINTCQGIANATGITTQQLISWNPNLNSDCFNINIITNYQICI
ncbi:hypothetical protein QBC46DRAFT_229373, partial [Diplogelasinospora grovesii]